MKERIRKAGILATKYTYKRYRNGDIPLALGPNGMLALIYDRVAQYMSGRQPVNTTELASLAICILVFDNALQDQQNISDFPLDNEGPTETISTGQRSQTGKLSKSSTTDIPAYELPDQQLIADLDRPLDSLNTIPDTD